jgi:hypothetical protein
MKYVLCDWFEKLEARKGTPIDVLDENFGFVFDLKILKQTENAIYCEQFVKNRLGEIWKGGMRWYPKSAFAYADDPDFTVFREVEIEKKLKFYKNAKIECGVNAMQSLLDSKISY